MYIGGFGRREGCSRHGSCSGGRVSGEGEGCRLPPVAAEGSRKARSNDVCLALEEGPLAGLEDTGFGTKMMAKGWKGQARAVETR